MAEISGPQSPHISSSSPTGEKVGSCAERQPLPRTPESPGSPFEMIANSPDFEFKDSATSKGLPYGPPKRDSSDKPAEAVSPLYFRHTHPGISVNEEQLFLNLDPILHFGRAAVPDSNSSWHSEQDNSATVDSHPKPVSGQAEAFLEPLPQGAQELCKRKMGGGDGTGQAAGSQAMTVEWGEAASSRSLERPYEAKAETRWPEADEEMDSSGESDDTVIDAGWRVKSSATERVQHTEESWGELGETQREEESGVPKRASEGACENPPVINESSSKAMVQTTGSPHCESFVDLAESCITEPFVRPDAASLEDKVQEYLTIEALRALADGAQAWDTESRESSPEVLNPLPQYGSSECITLSGWPNQEEILKDTDSTDETQTLKVRDLLSWRDMKKSGIVFGTVMVLLLSLAAFSIISVISYLVLALLSVTISYRVYKSVMQAVQKSEDGHPFKSLLEKDVTVSSDAFQKQVNASLAHVNRALKYSLRLFLVQDLIDSLKLAVLMWLMTYVGAVFNGITLLILGVLVAFTAPIVYEKYKVQIDRYVSLVQNQVKSITEKIQAKLPGALKKKSE